MKSCSHCKYFFELEGVWKRGACKIRLGHVAGQLAWPVKTYYNVCDNHENRTPWYCPQCDILTIDRYCAGCRTLMTRRNRWGPRKAKAWGYPGMVVALLDDEWAIMEAENDGL